MAIYPNEMVPLQIDLPIGPRRYLQRSSGQLQMAGGAEVGGVGELTGRRDTVGRSPSQLNLCVDPFD
jgi:hypothetical protein